MIQRRAFLTGLVSAFAAPAIVGWRKVAPTPFVLTPQMVIEASDWRYSVRCATVDVTHVKPILVRFLKDENWRDWRA